jgi:hypothetical protein
MQEDWDFNFAALAGCVIGGIAGYHAGGASTAVFGTYVGFAAGALTMAILAEASYTFSAASEAGGRFLRLVSPFATLGLLLAFAEKFWK